MHIYIYADSLSGSYIAYAKALATEELAKQELCGYLKDVLINRGWDNNNKSNKTQIDAFIKAVEAQNVEQVLDYWNTITEMYNVKVYCNKIYQSEFLD